MQSQKQDLRPFLKKGLTPEKLTLATRRKELDKTNQAPFVNSVEVYVLQGSILKFLSFGSLCSKFLKSPPCNTPGSFFSYIFDKVQNGNRLLI